MGFGATKNKFIRCGRRWKLEWKRHLEYQVGAVTKIPPNRNNLSFILPGNCLFYLISFVTHSFYLIISSFFCIIRSDLVGGSQNIKLLY